MSQIFQLRFLDQILRSELLVYYRIILPVFRLTMKSPFKRELTQIGGAKSKIETSDGEYSLHRLFLFLDGLTGYVSQYRRFENRRVWSVLVLFVTSSWG